MALEKYQKGIRYLNEEPDLEKEPAETKKALDALRYSLNSNSALLANKLKDYNEAFLSAEAALQVAGITNAEKAKSLFRRSVDNICLKDEDGAWADL